jgi:NADPH-dependent glutamate synthase beta subunit-like oxidoreductase
MDRGYTMGQALAEADRCLLCHDAPCSKACPAETDPALFIRKFHLKNITGAIRTIKQNNILGGACGVLCPTSRLCEAECSATGIDRPIEIGKIQRFLIEHSWETGFGVFKKADPRSERIAVLGSGPAGLSCAAELAKAGFKVTIFEARPESGGVLRYGVVSYRFDTSFLEKELNDVKNLGVELKCNSPITGNGDAENLLKEGFSAVFLGTGLWGAKQLIPRGGGIGGIYTSVNYLSALREDRLTEMEREFSGKTVAVIGGGSVAIDCVVSAVKLNARDVYLVYRRSYAQMPAEEDEKIEALHAGVHFLLLNQPVDYIPDGVGGVKGLKLSRTLLGDPDASGRRRPVPIENSDWTLPVDKVIEAIGNKAEDDSPSWYPHVKVNEQNLIQIDPGTGKTSVEGIFAGGDIARGPALVVTAVKDGKVAAKAIMDYLASK